MNLSRHYLEGKKRIIGLDILRSIAILLVMHEHGTALLPRQIRKFISLPQPSIDGVSIFFVLSGFLIGGILLKTIQKSDFTTKTIFNFWVRRWLRTIPNYIFVLIILVLIDFFLLKSHHIISFKYLFFSQNLYQPHPPFFPEAWSLSIEEWFYLSFPIFTYIAFKAIKNKNKSVILVAVIFLIIPLVARALKYSLSVEALNWDMDFRKIVILRLDSIMYGVIGAYISIFNRPLWLKTRKAGLVLSTLIITCLILYPLINSTIEIFRKVYHYNLQSISVFVALPFFSELTSIRYRKLTNFFTFISLISYSMYLVNLTLVRDIIIPSVIKLAGWNYTSNPINNVLLHFTKFSVFWILTLFIAYLLYKFVEIPFMNLRDRVKIN